MSKSLLIFGPREVYLLMDSNNNQILLDLEVCLFLLYITNTKRSKLLFKFLWNAVDKVTRASTITIMRGAV